MQAISLDGSRRRTYEILLAKRGGVLAGQYYSAMVVLESPVLPDRHAMVAHQLRQLINDLWTVVDDIAPAPEGPRIKNITDAVHAAAARWKKCLTITDWAAEVDWAEACKRRNVQTVLRRVHNIMASLDGQGHPEKEVLGRAALASDPSVIKARPAVYEDLVDRIWKVRGYFNDVSHRNRPYDVAPPDDQEFAGEISKLDALIDQFFPSIAEEDFDALDASIAEIERGA